MSKVTEHKHVSEVTLAAVSGVTKSTVHFRCKVWPVEAISTVTCASFGVGG
jgi:hypothetical protein